MDTIFLGCSFEGGNENGVVNDDNIRLNSLGDLRSKNYICYSISIVYYGYGHSI